jgi:quercetin dioxygenase-like cupin family protein
MMSELDQDRVFSVRESMQPSDGEPIRSVITESEHAAVIVWHVKPGQSIQAHVHPSGQDTWTVLSGSGHYQLDDKGSSRLISRGDVAVAPQGCVHGVRNDGVQPLVFVSVVAPAAAGYHLLEGEGSPVLLPGDHPP